MNKPTENTPPLASLQHEMRTNWKLRWARRLSVAAVLLVVLSLPTFIASFFGIYHQATTPVRIITTAIAVVSGLTMPALKRWDRRTIDKILEKYAGPKS